MYKNILIPMAPDHSHPLSESLEIARKIAAPGARITALSVVEMVPDYVVSQLPAGQLKKNADSIAASLRDEAGDEEGVGTDVVSGHPGNSIVAYANKHDMDCIVIASHRPGLQDYFLGSTAARVVRHAQCSVHVIR